MIIRNINEYTNDYVLNFNNLLNFNYENSSIATVDTITDEHFSSNFNDPNENFELLRRYPVINLILYNKNIMMATTTDSSKPLNEFDFINNSNISFSSSLASYFSSENNLTYNNSYGENNIIESGHIYNNSNNNIEENDKFDQYLQYSPIIEYIGDRMSVYYPPIIVFTGTLGNILSVFVFFKTKLRKLSSSYYLSALAISDTCFLLVAFVNWLHFFDIDLYDREIFCQFFTFFTFFCCFLSVWFVVAFTVERFIAVMYPLKRQSMCTVKRAKIVLCGLILIGLLHCTPFIIFSEPRFNSDVNMTICDVRPGYKDHLVIMNYVDTTVAFIVPFTTIAILNTIIGCTVWRFATVRRTMTAHRRKTQVDRTFSYQSCRPGSMRKDTSISISTTSRGCCTQQLEGINSTTIGGITCTTKSGRRKMANSSQQKVTRMLLIVSTVFVCLNLPSYVLRVLTFLQPEPPKITVAIQYITWFMFLTNFGINFVLYCASGQNFRKAVISIFRKVSSSSHRDPVTQVTEYTLRSNNGGGGIRTSRQSTRRNTMTHNGAMWNDLHELRQIVSLK